ncbi:MAG: isoprenylcysteine carboxylmethyltransferase family protein [Desulfobacterales bacterium]|jgi:protein-S-isoprenylcysteine O-methyltransferase Ste14
MILHENSVRAGHRLFRWRSYLPLFFVPILLSGLSEFGYPKDSHAYDLIWEMLCLSVSFFGFLVRCYTIAYVPKRTSGRNTKTQKADSLNITGMYSLMRNPLYFGNFFMFLGVTLFIRLWWISIIYGLAFWLYYERIILAEEAFLKEKYGKDYLDYAKDTPAFIPNFKNWKPPSLSFSFRHIIKREYSGFFAMIASFTVLEFVGDYIITGKIIIDKVWLCLFLGGFGVYITLRTLKKKTRILNVEGR